MNKQKAKKGERLAKTNDSTKEFFFLATFIDIFYYCGELTLTHGVIRSSNVINANPDFRVARLPRIRCICNHIVSIQCPFHVKLYESVTKLNTSILKAKS